jgi:RHS repeat-associated protein
VGNFEKLIHQATNGNWTRNYAYNEASLIESSKQSNRLSSTSIAGANPITEIYTYDVHGNMTSMPHLTLMEWDYKDQLSVTSRQAVSDTSPPDKVPETTFYVYDAGGERIRKVTEGQNQKRKNERIYLGGFEIYREFKSNGNDIKLERETLHVMDDKQRIALVETKTITNPNDDSPTQLIRFQFGNHLGSASLELNDQGDVISYEEYYPYGSTAYQAVDKSIKAAAKRYRYTGKERDEETGLYYHGARYYAPWLGRWTSCDPAAMIDGPNLYAYSSNNPLLYIDQHGLEPEKPEITSGRNPSLNRNVGVNEGEEGLKKLIGAKQEIKEGGRVISSGKGGSTIDFRTKFRSIESKVIDIGTKSYRKGKDALELKLSQVGSFGRRAVRQATKHEEALQKAGAINEATGEPLKETVVFTVKGAKNESEVVQVAKTLREASKTVALKAGKTADKAIKIGVVSSKAAQRGFVEVGLMKGIASSGFAAITGVLSYKELKQDIKNKDYGSALSSAAGVAASATTILAKGAGLVTGVSTSSVGLRTAVGGMSAAKGIAAAPYVVGAFAVGAAVGVGLEKTLDVSDYSSAVGMKADQAVAALGGGETARTVAGVTATILATPSSIGVAALDKVSGGRFAKWIGLK